MARETQPSTPITVRPAPTFATLGDSITVGAGNWGDTLATERNWTYLKNGGIGGSSLASFSSANAPMINRYLDTLTPTLPGHYFVFGGTNDWYINGPLGDVGSTDPVTVAGAALLLVRNVLGTPGMGSSIFYFVLPIWRIVEDTGPRNTAGYTLEQLRAVLRNVALLAAREFPGRVKAIETSALTDYYRTSSGVVSTLMNADGTHPQGEGKPLLGRHIAAQTLGANGLPPATFPQIYTYDRTFSTLTAGTIDNQDGWKVRRGAGTISASGLLVNAEWSAGAPGIQYEGASYGAGQHVEMLIKAGGGGMLEYKLQVDNRCDVLWFVGNSLDMGYRDVGGALTPYTGQPGSNVVPGALQGVDVWIRIGQVGSELRGWIYAAGTNCPITPYFIKTLSSAGNEPNLAAGFSSLVHLGSPFTALEFRAGSL